MNNCKKMLCVVGMLIFGVLDLGHAEPVKIGLNYPQTGPYSVQGKAQLDAAHMAVEEINAQGGILGRTIKLVAKDTQSKPDVSTQNVLELIDKENCEMIFGGSSSAVAIAGGKAAKSRDKLYFGTLTYSNSTTDTEGHKYMFRECYNAYMGAKALGKYLLDMKLQGIKYFYITADYTWGKTTEESIRAFSLTTDTKRHRRHYVPFPGATDKDLSTALTWAKAVKPAVLVLVLFGNDMSRTLAMLQERDMKDLFKLIVVPNLTLGMAKEAGAEAMEGVLGALPWAWNVPYKYDYPQGKKFVEKFSERYNSYPSTSAASAYTILYQYKEAVERAGTFDSKKLIAALEGHTFVSLKDEQQWRAFDHQALQTVYAVRGKPADEVRRINSSRIILKFSIRWMDKKQHALRNSG
ncbi:amino acid/amide ABC transporter substrate-binding protein, HAAT family [Candidatus Electrothrix aarhusensis]|uniref:Amino acid/amide ABC transporter substrate-binding protein, HAAT family n=1 Tax=Candidatus Electrothrix aarhusensis TaxID=1859131 RepID=A0A444IQ18_9BACT|nr:amino acid/amide ABC transporter substrate-binding protein, HAAT family [Candidatus Electrothrix aarhusensis]